MVIVYEYNLDRYKMSDYSLVLIKETPPVTISNKDNLLVKLARRINYECKQAKADLAVITCTNEFNNREPPYASLDVNYYRKKKSTKLQ